MPAHQLKFVVQPMGDRALLVKLSSYPLTDGPPTIGSDEKYARLLAARYLSRYLEQAADKPVVLQQAEFVAGYASVLIPFDPTNSEINLVRAWVEQQVVDFGTRYNTEGLESIAAASETPRLHRIPVIYGGEYGPDLEEVARLNQLTPAEVVALHSGQTYEVYLVGFAPGFAYLGPLPAGLDAPRLSRPRPRLPAGSVALAAGLTGVYPLASPGGWRIIGYTATQIFNPQQEPPVLFLPGDKVNFYPINH